MGNDQTKSLNFFKKQKKQTFKIVLLGLEASGKTTTLCHLKHCQRLGANPTIGFNVEDVEYKDKNFYFWDVGGGCKIRLLWKHYYPNTAAFLMVIDSCLATRIDEVRFVIKRVVEEAK